MKPCYLLAQITIHDKQEYQKYLDGFDEIFARYDARVLAVENDNKVLEGSWPYPRTVLIQFASETEARRWYDSPEYQKLMLHRQRASDSNIILINGREVED